MNAGVNYGNDILSGSYDADQITRDLGFIINTCGLTSIRIAQPMYTASSTIANIKAAALIAKGLGAYVSVGLCDAGSFGTDEQAAYQSAIDSLASWAQSNSINELILANEMELHIDGSMNAAAVRTYIRSLATRVKGTDGYGGKVGYTMCDVSIWDWLGDASLGSLDYLAANLYGTSENDADGWFEECSDLGMQQWGPGHFYISEWNLTTSWPFSMTDGQQATEVARREAYLAERLANYVGDPSFERDWDSNGYCDGVLHWGGVAGTPTPSLVAGRTGKAQRLQYTGVSGDSNATDYYCLNNDNISLNLGLVAAGQHATYTAWLKGSSSGCTAYLQLWAEDASYGYLGSISTTAITLSGTWTQYSTGSLTLPANTAHVFGVLAVAAVHNADTYDIYLDDSVLAISEITPARRMFFTYRAASDTFALKRSNGTWAPFALAILGHTPTGSGTQMFTGGEWQSAMPRQIYVGGTWQTVSGIYINVGGTWQRVA